MATDQTDHVPMPHGQITGSRGLVVVQRHHWGEKGRCRQGGGEEGGGWRLRGVGGGGGEGGGRAVGGGGAVPFSRGCRGASEWAGGGRGGKSSPKQPSASSGTGRGGAGISRSRKKVGLVLSCTL